MGDYDGTQFLARPADSITPGDVILDDSVSDRRSKRRTVLDIYRHTKAFQRVYVCPNRIILRVSGSDTLWVLDAGQLLTVVK